MRRLWAPWRIGYLTQARKPSSGDCLFCRIRKSRADSKNQVLVRGEHGFSLLNRFPYNNGHLMVAPYRHISGLDLLTETEWLDLFRLINDSTARLDSVVAPHGYNIGVNIGRTAGAGIPDHVHCHIVPRWVGDSNFMPVIAGVKVVSQSLAEAHRQLLRAQGSYRHAAIRNSHTRRG